MKGAYPVIFTETKDELNTFLIYVPDLDDMTEGYGLSNAIEMAKDIINITIIEAEDSGKQIPKPSSILNIDPKAGKFSESGDSFVSLVDFDSDIYRCLNSIRTA
ncbi:MAG: type II toxin-antitoxin system HicB family antitoxin [Lachnospiraceae bacterium]|nr:type II toxin-antitoxin system HicB family antitoxin [Lachnospiraceae bacterium]